MISDPSLGDTVFVLQTTGYVKSVGFHAREGQAPSGPAILDRRGPPPTYWESTEAVPPLGNRPRHRQYGRLGFDYYCGLLPSVAQPPFPLHEFLPGCLPPPWPLQSF